MSAPTPPPYGEPRPGQPPTYPSYANPPLYPAYQKPVPKRRRPSAWWFAVAGLLMVAGVTVGVLLIVQAAKTFLETDATIQADGRTVTVTVDADRHRMVWVDPFEQPVCTIVDAATGEEIRVDGLGETTYTKSSGSREWHGDGTFDPGSGDLEVTCDPTGGPMQIGPAPEVGDFVGGLVGGILLALLLGGGGFVLMILIAVLYATGRPRNMPAPQ